MAYIVRLSRQTYRKAIILLVFLTAAVHYYYVNFCDLVTQSALNNQSTNILDVEKSFYDRRKNWNTSKLGAILFKNEPYPVLTKEQANKTFVIMIYKRMNALERRHIYYYGSTRHDPLEECSVKNCIFTGNDTALETADAVIVHLHTGMLPETQSRKPHQRWIFLDDEAPPHTFTLAKRRLALSEMNNLFNWSMTYRSIADVPVPYGRTVPLEVPNDSKDLTSIIPNWDIKRKDVLAAILISNCAVSYRTLTIEVLKEYLKDRFHVLGKCGDNQEFKESCPGHFTKDCKLMSKYLFYIVLENAKCKQYVTEKLFNHAYGRGAIPVIQGPTKEDCEELLPPNSYLHFDNFTSVSQLVNKMEEISSNNEMLLYYHQWRFQFDVRNEHGFFGTKSYHLCRVCEAMNYNSNRTSIYTEEDLKQYLEVGSLCRKT